MTYTHIYIFRYLKENVDGDTNLADIQDEVTYI
jgi:hypothetical protein